MTSKRKNGDEKMEVTAVREKNTEVTAEVMTGVSADGNILSVWESYRLADNAGDVGDG